MPALSVRVLPSFVGLGLLCVSGGTQRVAHAQAQPLPMSQVAGFRLERYEPTTAGSPLFLADRPWFAPQRRFAAALTLGYAHGPLQFSDSGGPLPPIVEHALLGSLDVAGAPLRWLLLRASLPVTFFERGTTDPRAGLAPLEGAAIGDPRLGAMFALWRRPEEHSFSVHAGVDAWIPIGAGYVSHQGDAGPRVLPRVVLAGTVARALRWTFNAGFLYRTDAVLGADTRSIRAGSEVQLAAALGYATAAERLHIALEGLFAARVSRLDAASQDVLRGQLMLSAQVHVGSMLQLGAAAGSDFATPGTPDARALLRIAISPSRQASPPASSSSDSSADPPPVVLSPPPSWTAATKAAPTVRMQAAAATKPVVPAAAAAAAAATATTAASSLPPRDDADGDGILDDADRCPYEAETKNGIRDDDGCPESPLALQAARAMRFQKPAAAQSASAPSALTAPPASAETSPASAAPTAKAPSDPARPDGQPSAAAPTASATASAASEDSDKDGIPDEEDRCPVSAEDKDSFEDEDGCPDPDNDEDGILDAQDRCPLEAETQNGYEDEDGCPDVAPANALQVQVSSSGDRIEVNQQVQFQRRQAVVAPASYALLRAVAKVLRRYPKVSLEVQGHTDGGGDPARNMALSQQRADSVRAFLIQEGIAAERLQARGYGSTQPRYPETTAEGRARNRRVEFVLQGDRK